MLSAAPRSRRWRGCSARRRWPVATACAPCPTLDAAYDPMSYHCGSIWPHDTAIALLGLAAMPGDPDARTAAASLIDGLLIAGEAFDYRLPELYAGDDRADRPAAVAASGGVPPAGLVGRRRGRGAAGDARLAAVPCRGPAARAPDGPRSAARRSAAGPGRRDVGAPRAGSRRCRLSGSGSRWRPADASGAGLRGSAARRASRSAACSGGSRWASARSRSWRRNASSSSGLVAIWRPGRSYSGNSRPTRVAGAPVTRLPWVTRDQPRDRADVRDQQHQQQPGPFRQVPDSPVVRHDHVDDAEHPQHEHDQPAVDKEHLQPPVRPATGLSNADAHYRRYDRLSWAQRVKTWTIRRTRYATGPTDVPSGLLI